MYDLSSSNTSRIEQLKTHLRTNRYAASIERRHLWYAKRFVHYLENRPLAIETVRVPDLDNFLRWELRNWRRRFGRAPRDIVAWHTRYKTTIRMLLRLVHGHWPIPPEPATAREIFHRDVVQGYDRWMRDLRGLAAVTRATRTKHALEFLTALGSDGDPDSLNGIGVCHIDAYVQKSSEGFRRKTIEGNTVCLRNFLRYLHGSALTEVDLSICVIGPRVYDNEDIPSAMRQEDVQTILETARRDLSPAGRRDYAFLMLLATYGLRAGEIAALRLDDIDWKKEVLHVRHSKTGSYSELPLLREPGEAILTYLEKVRPESKHRQVFLHLQAPYAAYKDGSILSCIIGARLRAAGITPPGRKGAHSFRHGRAISLLHAAVPLKIIGDVLGHRSADSTAVYLKLATEDLRGVGLSVPKGVMP